MWGFPLRRLYDYLGLDVEGWIQRLGWFKVYCLRSALCLIEFPGLELIHLSVEFSLLNFHALDTARLIGRYKYRIDICCRSQELATKPEIMILTGGQQGIIRAYSI